MPRYIIQSSQLLPSNKASRNNATPPRQEPAAPAEVTVAKVRQEAEHLAELVHYVNDHWPRKISRGQNKELTVFMGPFKNSVERHGSIDRLRRLEDTGRNNTTTVNKEMSGLVKRRKDLERKMEELKIEVPNPLPTVTLPTETYPAPACSSCSQTVQDMAKATKEGPSNEPSLAKTLLNQPLTGRQYAVYGTLYPAGGAGVQRR